MPNGILDVFLENINIFTPIFIALGVALGIGVGMILARPRKNQVMKILPNDNRGYDFDIVQENAFSVLCKGFDTLPDQRFIKCLPSILVKQKRWFGRTRTISRYLGREGTAFTQQPMSDTIENIPLPKTLRTIWGSEFYDQIPEEQRTQLEEKKVGVTIQLDAAPLIPVDPKTNKPLPRIGEEDIKREEDLAAAQTFWKGKAMAQRGQWINNIAWVGFGFGVCLVVCLLMNWIKIG